jgi:hypothetical protein
VEVYAYIFFVGLAPPILPIMEVNVSGASLKDLVAEHRQLTRQIKALETQRNEVRERVLPLVMATDGNQWKDESGYAKMKKRSSSISYSGKEVDSLMLAWVESEDNIMNSCGQMLKNLRKVKPASTYLEIK